MNIDFSQKIKEYNGTPVKLPDVDVFGKVIREKEITLGDMAIECLQSQTEAEKDMDGKEKLSRYNLGLKIYQSMKENKPLALEIEDANKIKELIGKRFLPKFVGPAFLMMEKE